MLRVVYNLYTELHNVHTFELTRNLRESNVFFNFISFFKVRDSSPMKGCFL